MTLPTPHNVPNRNWSYPTAIKFGVGRIAELAEHCAGAGVKKPLFVTDKALASLPITADAVAVLPRLSVADCLHYTLTLDPDVALLGMSFPNEQDEALAAAHSFAPLSGEQLADIRRRAIEARQDKGPCWWNPDPEA